MEKWTVIAKLEDPDAASISNDSVLILLQMALYVHLDADWGEKHKVEQKHNIKQNFMFLCHEAKR